MAKRRQASAQDVDLDQEDVRLRDGSRLTREVADAIVEDVRRKVGRPSLTGGAAVSPRVTFRLTPDVRDRAAAIADREGKTVPTGARGPRGKGRSFMSSIEKRVRDGQTTW